MKKLPFIFLYALFILIPLSAIGQNPDIEITDLSLENNQLVIHYAISKAKKKQAFEVWPEITTANGQKINASTLSGDYGTGIIAGTDKKIIWDYSADGVILNEKVFVELKAKISISNTKVSTGKALIISAIFPGVGITKLNGGGAYWLMSIATYGLVVGSIVKNSKAFQNYEDYKNNSFQNAEEADDIYREALDYQKQSQTFAYAAIGLWSVNMIWTFFKARKNNKSTASYYQHKKTLFYSGINPSNKSIGFTLKYRF